jgi:hypothetical protein
MDRDTIIFLTFAVRLYRRLRELGVYDMPLELKGLKGKALNMRSNIERLNRAYDKFNELAPEHAADVEGLTSQVNNMNDDLSFAVNALGNSTVASGATGEAKTTSVLHEEGTIIGSSTSSIEPPAVGQDNTHFPTSA